MFGLFSFGNFNLTYALRIGLDPLVLCEKLLPKHVYYVEIRRKKPRQKSWLETVAHPGFEPRTFSWPPESALQMGNILFTLQEALAK